jgi:hypothetical protein
MNRNLKLNRQCRYSVTLRDVHATICCSGKAIRNTYNEHVSVALVIQHAMPMHHIVICGLPPSSSFSPIIAQSA